MNRFATWARIHPRSACLYGGQHTDGPSTTKLNLNSVSVLIASATFGKQPLVLVTP
jgi:hypothetical protein